MLKLLLCTVKCEKKIPHKFPCRSNQPHGKFDANNETWAQKKNVNSKHRIDTWHELSEEKKTATSFFFVLGILPTKCSSFFPSVSFAQREEMYTRIEEQKIIKLRNLSSKFSFYLSHKNGRDDNSWIFVVGLLWNYLHLFDGLLVNSHTHIFSSFCFHCQKLSFALSGANMCKTSSNAPNV